MNKQEYRSAYQAYRILEARYRLWAREANGHRKRTRPWAMLVAETAQLKATGMHTAMSHCYGAQYRPDGATSYTWRTAVYDAPGARPLFDRPVQVTITATPMWPAVARGGQWKEWTANARYWRDHIAQ